ncbi:bifunctional phosphopantothenoylcysteine decarboxylase/phosphopantothenate--cysteine ligase CoaBC [Helicobacter canis]|uniref:Coenzyme A biosynthesis bifunctional protein CoaBC n=1 Tax=Helicobacter canis NCTC 12740 TaxID=1357399 RepID=V8CHA0_9HELI|nr:bifunctional phosphopantothenoylcysteine decarboxylase/phosphopantothenate--cysteine ligase CoaBC [Helicobacter canis]ETD26793.1 phosphopantothenoylcysteine decarboxylase/phosphopantothenate-cysteine ligase [Helicobacter canis NCTC 12740]
MLDSQIVAPSAKPSTLAELLEQTPLHSNILLCVSGSIAAYKALELASMLKKLGAQVAVVMSQSAQKFITPLSFEAITHNKVLCEQSEEWSTMDTSVQKLDSSSSKADRPHSCNHIAYAKWADLCILAPATASSIAKLAHGIADNLLTQTLLATSAPILCAPAMNTAMLESKQTQANLTTLAAMGVQIIEPKSALLACNTQGIGALADVEELVFALLKASKVDRFWLDREVYITGGGASAMLDPVRAITNHSSGLQASALAIALYTLGARVRLISSSFPTPLPRAIEVEQVRSNDDYKQALLRLNKQRKKHSKQRAILLMAAALADFAPKYRATSKIKKSKTTQLHLALEPTQDILASLDSSDFVKVGFKAEDSLEVGLSNARAMLLPRENGGKDCEIVCLNTLDSSPFGASHNAFTLLNRQSLQDSSARTLPHSTKLALSYEIASFIKASLEHLESNA